MNATQEQLDALFPTPSPSPSGIAPTRLPGYDCQTTETLLELLKDNHKRYHIFFNDMGFHKSVPFTALYRLLLIPSVFRQPCYSPSAFNLRDGCQQCHTSRRVRDSCSVP